MVLGGVVFVGGVRGENCGFGFGRGGVAWRGVGGVYEYGHFCPQGAQ